MKKIDGDVTLLIDEQGARIEVRDKNASLMIVDIKMTARDFMAALGRLGHCLAEIQVTEHPERIGTTMKFDRIEFPLSKKAENSRRWSLDKLAHQEAVKYCSKYHPGWIPDDYYGGQESYFIEKDGRKWARTIIRKWE